MNKITSVFKKITRQTIIGILILFVSILVIIFTSWILYNRTSQILDTNLRQRLLSIVTTAVVGFDANDVQQLHLEDDWKKPEWAKVVRQMEKIRKNNPNILFVYMFRKTDADPAKMEFVSDSHSIDPYGKIDINNDGVIDDGDQLQWPGQAYETAPTEAFEAYNGPITNKEIYSDQWGPVLTGYAPIKDDNGDTVGVLAVDIKANDFLTITRQTLQPFLIFIASLSLIISILILTIIYSWKKYTKSLEKINNQLQQANQGQASLMHFMNHQIKGRLGNAKNIFAELLTDDYGAMPDFARPLLQKGVEETTTGVDYVQNILKGASAENGTLPYDMKPIDMKVVVETAFAQQKDHAEKKSLELSLNVEPSDYSMVGDALELGEAVRNLIDNSINYTQKGSIKVSLKRGEKTVKLEVKDTGVGITKEDMGKLFQAGGRGAESVKINTNSTGYGLVFVRGVIEAHKGKVWVESEGSDKGSTFFIEIPKN